MLSVPRLFSCGNGFVNFPGSCLSGFRPYDIFLSRRYMPYGIFAVVLGLRPFLLLRVVYFVARPPPIPRWRLFLLSYFCICDLSIYSLFACVISQMALSTWSGFVFLFLFIWAVSGRCFISFPRVFWCGFSAVLIGIICRSWHILLKFTPFPSSVFFGIWRNYAFYMIRCCWISS